MREVREGEMTIIIISKIKNIKKFNFRTHKNSKKTQKWLGYLEPSDNYRKGKLQTENGFITYETSLKMTDHLSLSTVSCP